LDYACQDLLTKNVAVLSPKQFEDIGYIPHLSYPEGFQIKLLQHASQGQKKVQWCKPMSLLVADASLGRSLYVPLILTEKFPILLMKWVRISSQSNLCLPMVLAFTFLPTRMHENPPQSDLLAVQNRPWLWQRPYTVAELQHIHDSDADLLFAEVGLAGFFGLALA
jgi:hypothetical protein